MKKLIIVTILSLMPSLVIANSTTIRQPDGSTTTCFVNGRFINCY